MRENERKLINGKKMVMGVCYYPEHWEKKLWAEDMDRMLAAGIRVVRIAEFAWNQFEPREGEYQFAFFDEFLELAQKKGMQVIFCTPTATPPAWLSAKYPEILNTDQDGNYIRHGSRRHYNYNSPVYREFTARLVERLGAHYGPHPAVIGWQLDNELNCETDQFYSESDAKAFRRFLQDKYQTLDALNHAWGTLFWNQTYTDWEEVDVPRRTNNDSTNPHRVLDYIRFISDSACSFAGLQAEILRKHIKETDFITTNGIFRRIDYQRLVRESLDFITYDSYPDFAYELDSYDAADPFKDRWWSRKLTEVRGISPVFGIMEQQSGPNGWNNRMEAPAPRPGQLTLWTMQSIAHGADFISYFRWRTCTMGTEIYWHGILDYSGRENRRLREVASVGEKLEKLQPAAGAEYAAKVGILRDYDNQWDTEYDRWHKRVDSFSQDSLFLTLQRLHTPFDYVDFREGMEPEALKKYEVLFYPHAAILTKERAALLEAYVAAGGKLVAGCRTGYKELTGKCVTEPLPGLLGRLTGTDIPEYTFVSPQDGHVYVDWDGEKVEAAIFNDLLMPAGEKAEVLGVYADSYYAGTPALIKNSFGKGEAYYFGGAFAPDTVRKFAEKLHIAEPYRALVELSESCELAVREKEGGQFLFVLNYKPEEAEITLKRTVTDLFTGESVNGAVVLSPYQAKVYRVN